MKRPVVAVLVCCLLLLAVLLCIPEFREGLGVADALARNTLGAMRGDFADRDLERLADRAKSTGNADLLAYAALRNPGPNAILWLRDAVQMNPDLAWTYAELCGDMRWDNTPQCAEGISALETRDPDNSAPYLMEAAHIARVLDPQLRSLEKSPNDPRWGAAMAKAFAAPRYDDYVARYTALQKRVYLNQHASSLTQFASGLFRSAVPQFSQPKNYAHEALADTPQATIDFSRRVIAGSNSSFEQFLATSLLLQAYERANQLKPGSVSEVQIAADTRILRLSSDRERTYFPLLDRFANVFQLIVLCGALTLFGLVLLLLAAGWQLSRHNAVATQVQTVLCIDAALFGFSAVSLLIVYRPYSALIHQFLQQPTFSSSLAPWPFIELYSPYQWIGPTSAGWLALLVLCAIALLAVVSRFIGQRRTTLTTATP